MALSAGEWLRQARVQDFLSQHGQAASGSLIRFSEVAPNSVQQVIADAPVTVAMQASDEGPANSDLLNFAIRHGATIGGFASTTERDDVVFVLDALCFPTGAPVPPLPPHWATPEREQVGGFTHLWWD